MEFHLLHIFTILSLALVVSHATPVNEVYWNTMLNNTRMPKALKQLLKSEDQSTIEKAIEVSKMNVNSQSLSDPLFSYKSYASKDPQSVKFTSYRYDDDDDLQKNANPQSDSPFAYRYANDLRKSADPRSDFPFGYDYDDAKNTHHKNNHNTTIFFLEKDLHQGTYMSLHFANTSNGAAFFLPREIADSIPFSSRKMPVILNQLSVNPNSREAQIIKKSIKQCEDPGIKEEEKLCVTSLESMIDFSIAKLGKNVEAMSTEAENATHLQNYNILGLKKMASEKTVVCHKQKYPYAVFYCHKTYATEVFMVSLVGDHGGRVEAVAVCHQDTSEWNPKHLAFVLLKVKPGTVPICHFLPEDHVVWITK